MRFLGWLLMFVLLTPVCSIVCICQGGFEVCRGLLPWVIGEFGAGAIKARDDWGQMMGLDRPAKPTGGIWWRDL